MDIAPANLRSFLVLGRELHFGRAAAVLGISTPGLSKQISKLEAQLGRPLFVRSARSLQLTATGATLMPIAHQAVTAFDDLNSWTTDDGSTRGESVLRIGIAAGGLGAHTAPIIARCHLELPAVRLKFHRVDFHRTFAGLLEGSIDILLTSGTPNGLPPGVQAGLTLSDPRVLVVGKQHRLAHRSWVTLEETSSEVYIRMGSEKFHAAARRWVIDPRPDGRTLTWGPQTADMDTAMDMCAAGLGVNLSVESARYRWTRPDICFIPVRDAPAATMVACIRACTTDPLVHEFLAIANKVCRVSTSARRGARARAG